MKTLFVVDEEGDCPGIGDAIALTTAKAYLTESALATARVDRVVNLCRCEEQSPGFYVSLLAEARGHAAFPSSRTLEDLRADVPAAISDVAPSFAPQPGQALVVHSYFGADPEGRHPAISERLFSLLGAPLVRAEYEGRSGGWRLARVQPIGLAHVPAAHRARLLEAAKRFADGQPAIAILHTPGERLPPSNPAALAKMVAAAARAGLRAELIDRHALARLPEFDALFIRDTTWLGHYTYEFAQRAAALGLVVVDDPDSILQCNNKVYLHELFTRHGIPTPRTLMVHRGNVDDIVPTLGLPCVLKEPGGGFSLGVRRAASVAEARRQALEMLERSALIIAQEFIPTQFDWRVGVFDRRPLFVCQYFMAPGHWQVHKYEPGRHFEGASVAMPLGKAPQAVVRTALNAANLIGRGLYGVDLKQAGERCVVIEVNDNPSIDAGNEDQLLQDMLYRDLMEVFARRILERRGVAAA
ncbi:MAG TPA: RimK family protein [Burkholderiales bacterium]|nr:RimK family protein [Burkholderiales bacterium]